VQRVSQIYTIMKRNHWWLTGRGDICVCALLAANNGMPIVIEGMADEIYRRLIDHGFNCEHHVLIAANILTMADIPAMTAVDRFLALIAHVQASAVPSWTENFDSLALLSLLGHGPERITERLNAMTTRLKGFKPLPFAAINFAIAADLVFLELVRLDDDLVEIAEPVELMRMEQLIHYQSAISFLMVDVPQEQILMASGM
jgi:hypothetical protein